MLRRLSIAVAASAFAVTGALAQFQTTDISLTPEIVESFAESFPAVKAKGEELRSEYDVPDDADNPASAWQAWMAYSGAKAQLDATVGAYGFSDFNSWVQTLSAIARAYAFTKEGGSIDAKMAEALEKVRNDPNIPAGQKEMIIQQLQHSAGAIAGMKPSQENIDAVAPYVDQLGAAFESE